jgi:hypothetical protein
MLVLTQVTLLKILPLKYSVKILSVWLFRLCGVRLTPHSTGYTHSLNHNTDNILTLYFNVKNFKKSNFGKDQHELPEDDPYGPKHAGAFIQKF